MQKAVHGARNNKAALKKQKAYLHDDVVDIISYKWRWLVVFGIDVAMHYFHPARYAEVKLELLMGIFILPLHFSAFTSSGHI